MRSPAAPANMCSLHLMLMLYVPAVHASFPQLGVVAQRFCRKYHFLAFSRAHQLWFVAAASELLVMLPRALDHQESEAERRAQLLRLAHLAYSARRVRLHHPGWHFLVQSVRESSRFLQYLAASSWQQLLATSTHVLTHLSIALFQ